MARAKHAYKVKVRGPKNNRVVEILWNTTEDAPRLSEVLKLVKENFVVENHTELALGIDIGFHGVPVILKIYRRKEVKEIVVVKGVHPSRQDPPELFQG